MATLFAAMPKWLHFEADMFFLTGPNGEYEFNEHRLEQAHAWCLNQTRDALEQGYNVVVSNTFTKQWELTKYIELAKERSITPHVMTCHNQFGNEHAVPEAAIERMRARWQYDVLI